MVGVEYILLHAQEPILYIIRKQQRQSPTQGGQQDIGCLKMVNHTCVTQDKMSEYPLLSVHSLVIPLADYYIIAGVVYQAPDLGTVISSRAVNIYYRGFFFHVWENSEWLIWIVSVLALCCPRDPVCFWWGHVILPLSPIQGILVALQGPGGKRLDLFKTVFLVISVTRPLMLRYSSRINTILSSSLTWWLAKADQRKLLSYRKSQAQV